MDNQNLAQNLREALDHGVVSFSYEKANGEWREAHGTRNPKGIEYADGELPKGTGSEKSGTIAYYDIDVNGWRSCKEDKIIAINCIKTLDEYIRVEEDKAIQEGLNNL